MKDTFKHKGLRKRLVELLHKKGIKNTEVLRAMAKIPRHFFLDSALAEHAYEDKALPINDGQTISQPYTVAYQTEWLQLKPGHKVLEVGTGSGYQGSIICELGCELISIERFESLSVQAGKIMAALGYSAELIVGDGSLGFPEKAPYDAIIVTAAAPDLNENLIKQLKKGGRMIIPVGQKEQIMYGITRDQNGVVKARKMDSFRFVPLIGKAGFREQ